MYGVAGGDFDHHSMSMIYTLLTASHDNTAETQQGQSKPRPSSVHYARKQHTHTTHQIEIDEVCKACKACKR